MGGYVLFSRSSLAVIGLRRCSRCFGFGFLGAGRGLLRLGICPEGELGLC